MTTRHAPTATINRTGYAAARRAEGWEGIRTDTVPSGPSAVRNAEGPRLPTGARSCLGGSSPIRPVHGKGVTAVPTLARRSPVRPTAAPRVASEVAA